MSDWTYYTKVSLINYNNPLYIASEIFLEDILLSYEEIIGELVKFDKKIIKITKVPNALENALSCPGQIYFPTYSLF